MAWQAANGRVKFSHLDPKRKRENFIAKGADSDADTDKDADPVTGVEERQFLGYTCAYTPKHPTCPI